MAVLNIGGQRVKVGDEFLKLTPDQQNATVEEIAANLPDVTPQAIPGGGVTDVPKGGAPTQIAPGSNPVQEGDIGEAFSPEKAFAADQARQQVPTGVEDQVDAQGNPIPVGREQPASEVTSAKFSDFARSFEQGLSAGFGDEIEAYVRSLIGDESYDKELKDVRGSMERFRKTNPEESIVGELVGGLYGLGKFEKLMKAPKTLGQAIKQAFVMGAAYSGVYGFGSGEGLEDRAKKGAVGLVAGGAIGAAVPMGGAAIKEVGKTARSGYRMAFTPKKEAEARAAEALAVDKQLGRPAMTAAEAQAAREAGQPVMTMDRGGDATRELAQSAGNTSPVASDVLQRSITRRFDEAGDRITQTAQEVTYGPISRGRSAAETRSLLEAQAKKANAPAYQNLYKKFSGPVISQELVRLGNSNIVSKAIKKVVTGDGQDYAVAQGLGAFKPKVTIDQNGKINWRDKDGNLVYPDIQFWDYVQRTVGRMAKRGEDGIDPASGFKILDDLKNELDRLTGQEFRNVRQGAAAFFRADNALEAGSKFATAGTRSIDPNQIPKQLSKMSKAERYLFREGYIDQKIRDVAAKGKTATAVDKFLRNKWEVDKMRLALGDQAPQFEAFLRAEAAMDLARGVVQGFSTTTRQATRVYTSSALKRIAGYTITGWAIGGATTGDWFSARAVLGGAMVGAARELKFNMTPKVADNIAKLLTSDNPKLVQKAAKLIASDKKFRLVMRKLGAAVSVPVGQANKNTDEE